MTIKQGVYDISNEDYHNSDGISRSGIMKLKQTPYHYWNHYINPDRPPKKEYTEALTFGNLLHTYILEPAEFHTRYVVAKKVDKRTKDGKAYWEEMEASRGSREIINEDIYNETIKIAESVFSNEQAKELITGAQYEKSIYWNDPETGILCKVRPDIWHSNMICDLKSAADGSPHEFQRSVYKYGYYMQAAMIFEAMRVVFGVEIKNFIFIVLEKEFPYAPAIYQLDQLAIEFGLIEFKNKLALLKQCQIRNEWPGYQTQIISLPSYVKAGE